MAAQAQPGDGAKRAADAVRKFRDTLLKHDPTTDVSELNEKLAEAEALYERMRPKP